MSAQLNQRNLPFLYFRSCLVQRMGGRPLLYHLQTSGMRVPQPILAATPSGVDRRHSHRCTIPAHHQSRMPTMFGNKHHPPAHPEEHTIVISTFLGRCRQLRLLST
eukprot:4289848-Amphidinium_carterae.1